VTLLTASASDGRSRRTYRFALLAILFFSLVVRLAWGIAQPSDDASLRLLPDQSEYLELARNLLNGRGLCFADDRFGQTVYAYRMPGYPAVVAACLGRPQVVRALQAVLDTSTVLAVALLALAFVPAGAARRASLIAAAIVAVNPFLIFFSGLLLSETVFTSLLAWAMVFLVFGARGGRFRTEPRDTGRVPDSAAPAHRPWIGTALWLLGGLTIASTAMVRPTAAPLAVVLGILASLAARPRAGEGVTFRPRWPFPVGTTMLLFTAAVLTPWAYRNSQVVGRWVWTTTNAGVTAYDGFNPDATGASDQLVLKALPQLRTMNEVERSDYLSARAERFVRDNPHRAADLALAKAGRTWSPIPLSDEYGNWRYRLAGFAYSVPLDLFVMIGLCRSDLRRSAKAVLLAPAVYFTLVHMASVGSLRYRIPVEPPLAVLAAAGIASGRTREARWRRAGGDEVAE
jgi:hypothetical protein